MDIGTISIVVVLGLIILLAIGMPLGFASAVLALVVLVLKFEPTLVTDPGCYLWTTCEELRIPGLATSNPGTGPLYLLTQKIFDLMTQYVLISVPLFIFMAALLERSGIAKEMYNALDFWLSRVRGGVAIVTSIMAVIMAAMSGIIGGEVVLLGLIALPQMLRLGYNQNLAIGTICASGSLGTMIPPSIVLIIYGLITETSIKALFTGAFVPGFMLAMMIITYIIIRTQLRPEDAPLPDPDPVLEQPIQDLGISMLPKIVFGILAVAFIALYVMIPGSEEAEDLIEAAAEARAELEATLAIPSEDAQAAQDLIEDATGVSVDGVVEALTGEQLSVSWQTLVGQYKGLVFTAAALLVACFIMSFSAKGQVFSAFVWTVLFGLGIAVLVRALFFTITGQNSTPDALEEPIGLGMTYNLPYIAAFTVFAIVLAITLLGPKRMALGWHHGKGLVPPLTVVGVVLGSIYGGITGITEAAGMGALAVFLIALFRGEASVALLWESLMRTLRSTGTIIWVTIGAAALAGAYTLAGGPNYIANLIVGSELPTMLVILTMMLIFLFMGAFMDWVGIVLLIIPVFLPIVKRLPIEEIGYFGQLEPQHISIWFGVVFCMNMQVSFLSPPFGPAAFYLKSVAPPHISLTDIFKAFLPFIGVQLLALSVLLIWPPIVTLLL